MTAENFVARLDQAGSAAGLANDVPAIVDLTSTTSMSMHE